MPPSRSMMKSHYNKPSALSPNTVRYIDVGRKVALYRAKFNIQIRADIAGICGVVVTGDVVDQVAILEPSREFNGDALREGWCYSNPTL